MIKFIAIGLIRRAASGAECATAERAAACTLGQDDAPPTDPLRGAAAPRKQGGRNASAALWVEARRTLRLRPDAPSVYGSISLQSVDARQLGGAALSTDCR